MTTLRSGDAQICLRRFGELSQILNNYQFHSYSLIFSLRIIATIKFLLRPIFRPKKKEEKR